MGFRTANSFALASRISDSGSEREQQSDYLHYSWTLAFLSSEGSELAESMVYESLNESGDGKREEKKYDKTSEIGEESGERQQIDRERDERSAMGLQCSGASENHGNLSGDKREQH